MKLTFDLFKNISCIKNVVLLKLQFADKIKKYLCKIQHLHLTIMQISRAYLQMACVRIGYQQIDAHII